MYLECMRQFMPLEWTDDQVARNYLANQILLIATSNLYLAISDPEFTKKDNDLNQSIETLDALNEFFGFDVSENSNWKLAIEKTSLEETCQFIINEVIKALRDEEFISGISERMYIVAFSDNYRAQDWERLLEGPSEDGTISMILLRDELKLTTDMDWNERESAELSQLEIGQGLECYSSEVHSIYRIM